MGKRREDFIMTLDVNTVFPSNELDSVIDAVCHANEAVLAN